MQKLNARTLGYAGAIVSALIMFILWVFGKFGIYTEAVSNMEDWHLFFSPSIGGLFGGMIEAAVISFIILWIFGRLYNVLAEKN